MTIVWKIFGLPSARVVIWMIERSVRRNATADPARVADILKRTAALRERLKKRGDRTLMPERHTLRHPLRFVWTRGVVHLRRVVRL